jgi:hypothetical protein
MHQGRIVHMQCIIAKGPAPGHVCAITNSSVATASACQQLTLSVLQSHWSIPTPTPKEPPLAHPAVAGSTCDATKSNCAKFNI